MCHAHLRTLHMAHSIGRDLRTRGKFHIVGVDESRGMVLLHHADDGWLERPTNAEEVPWTQFILDLKEGRYELTPTGTPLPGR